MPTMPPKRKRAAASTNAPKAKVPKSETTATAATGPVLNIKLASDPSKIPVLPFDILTEIVDHLGRDASSGDSQALAGLAGLMPLSSEMYALASVQLYRRVVLTATQWDKFLYGVPHFTVKDQKALAKAEAKAAGPGTKGRRPRPKKPAIELTPTKGSERKLALLKLVRGVRYESAKKVPLLPSQRLFPALETLEIAPRTYLDILDDGAEGFSTVTIEHALFKAMALERPRHVCIGIPTTAEAKDYIKRRAPPGRGPRDGGHGHPNCDCAARQAQGRFEKLQRGRGLEWFAEVVRDWKPESVTIHHWRFYAAPTFATEYLRLFPADCPCTAVLPVDPTLRVGRLVHAHVEHCIANDIRFWERTAHSLHGATHGLMYSLKDKPTRIEVPGIGSNVPAGTMCCAESYASTLRRYKTGLVRFAGESLSTPNAADAAPCSCCGVRPPADFADVEKTLLPTITCLVRRPTHPSQLGNANAASNANRNGTAATNGAASGGEPVDDDGDDNLVDDQDGFMFGEDDFTEDEDGHPDALILPNNNFVYHQWESCLPSLENETYDPRDYFEFDNGDDYDNDPHWDAESNPDLYNSFEGYYDEFDEFDYDDIMDGASDFDDDMNGWDDGY